MKLSTVVFAFAGLAGGVAAAQPNPDQTGTGTTDINPQPPQQQTVPPPIEHTAPVAEPASSIKPTELAFAIGLGYLRPPGGSVDLQTPNIASVRVRLPSGLTFEPTFSIANSSTDTEMAAVSTTDTTTEFSLSTLVRLPVITHRHVDFEILASAGFGVTKVNPEGDFNTKTTSGFGVGWGLAVGYWITQHWQLSANATNPLVGYQSVTTQTGPDTQSKTSSTNFGVTFAPTIFVMLHLYN